jgi:putative transposase
MKVRGGEFSTGTMGNFQPELTRRPVGRRQTSKEVQELIFRMVVENPTWGAPRIHGELLMLSFDVSERTISRWMKQAPRDPEPAKRWLTFLRNHREAIAAMDFFTVPTITFSVLYCFFVISHDRRRILHFNVTNHPTSLWIVQQLREAFPFESAPRFVIFFDRDAKYGLEVPAAVRSLGVSPVRTSFESPWQNGARAWAGDCPRTLSSRCPQIADSIGAQFADNAAQKQMFVEGSTGTTARRSRTVQSTLTGVF